MLGFFLDFSDVIHCFIDYLIPLILAAKNPSLPDYKSYIRLLHNTYTYNS